MKKNVAASIACLALTGCASIFSGTTTNVEIRSTPGATYKVTNTYGSQVASGVIGDDSTASINLTRGAGYFSPHAYKVNLSKPGYRPSTVPVDPTLNPLYFGNILFGGFVGMIIVDPLTGAMFRMLPGREDAQLEPSGENVAGIEGQEAVIKQANSFPVSRNDYAARERARMQKCTPLANPEVVNGKEGEELLTFQCSNNTILTITCNTGTGCR